MKSDTSITEIQKIGNRDPFLTMERLDLYLTGNIFCQKFAFHSTQCTQQAKSFFLENCLLSERSTYRLSSRKFATSALGALHLHDHRELNGCTFHNNDGTNVTGDLSFFFNGEHHDLKVSRIKSKGIYFSVYFFLFCYLLSSWGSIQPSI